MSTNTYRTALQRAAAIDPEAYARTRNHLDGAVTGLSPWITHGVVSDRQVLTTVLDRHELPVQHRLVQELGWRAFFRHVWAHRGAAILQDLHPGPQPRSAYADRLPDDVREARTGLPVIDQAVRELYATGRLHNHARLWLASYVVHLRHVHWRAGADWMFPYLLDGDLASNHLSWQWVAGTGSHQPYLFNADNVARFAPPGWHSSGTAIDVSYDTLEVVARGSQALPLAARGANSGVEPPPLWRSPPPGLTGIVEAATRNGLSAPQVLPDLRGQQVWIVHPWNLRPPPDAMANARVLGIYPMAWHEIWPWSERRWAWVDAAMAELTPHRLRLDRIALAHLLAEAVAVDTDDDPHLQTSLPECVRRHSPRTLFAPQAVERRSFSRWWRDACAGSRQARDLLEAD